MNQKGVGPQLSINNEGIIFLAVQDSSIGDLVTQSVSESVSQVLISATSET